MVLVREQKQHCQRRTHSQLAYLENARLLSVCPLGFVALSHWRHILSFLQVKVLDANTREQLCLLDKVQRVP